MRRMPYYFGLFYLVVLVGALLRRRLPRRLPRRPPTAAAPTRQGPTVAPMASSYGSSYSDSHGKLLRQLLQRLPPCWVMTSLWVIIFVSPRARTAWLESRSSHRWPAHPRGGVQTQQGASDHRATVAAAPRGLRLPARAHGRILQGYSPSPETKIIITCLLPGCPTAFARINPLSLSALPPARVR